MNGPTAGLQRSSASTLLAVGLMFGCGGETDGATAKAGSDDVPGTGAAARSGSADTTSPFEVCPGPLGSPEDLAATPRADETLEFLALAVEPPDAVVVSQANDERVVADVAAIRALVPELAAIEYRPPHDGRSVSLSFSDAAVDAWGMGVFAGLHCLNDALGATYSPALDNFDFFYRQVSLRGVHDMPRVVELYEQLPGVGAHELVGNPEDGPTWCIGRNGADYEYVIDSATGGCSSGCQEHEAHHFSSSAAGDATALEVWRSAEGEPPAEWYARLCQ